MIIVSQDKRLITESLALSVEDIEGEEKKRIMVQEYCGKLYLLGVYETEERAKEVLKEILEAYKNCNYYSHSQMGKGFVINDYYEMPEE